MVILNIEKTNTFGEWRAITNLLSAGVGDLEILTVPPANTMVDAMNGAKVAWDQFSQLANDLDPSLGADLDLNNYDITGTGNINITSMTVSSTLTNMNGVTASQGDNSTKAATTGYMDSLPSLTRARVIALTLVLGTYYDSSQYGSTTGNGSFGYY